MKACNARFFLGHVDVFVRFFLLVCTCEVLFCSGYVQADSAEASAITDSFPVVTDPQQLTSHMEEELRGCFNFFWNEQVSN